MWCLIVPGILILAGWGYQTVGALIDAAVTPVQVDG